MQRVLRDAGPDVPMQGLGTFGDQVNQVVAPQRLGVTLLGSFGVLTLLVASVGIYGVVAYSVTQRTREIGIRMALGARTGAVFANVLARDLRWVVAGLPAGLLLAYWLTSPRNSCTA